MDKQAITQCFNKPLMDLLLSAQHIHRQYFLPNTLQAASLLSIKTGACPEDCGYCSQSGHYKTGLGKEKLISLEAVKDHVEKAKAEGATRVCLGAAWRSPPKKHHQTLTAMIEIIKSAGLEACVTLGMLDDEDILMLEKAGLDYYNHNLDTSREYYEKVTTTRRYDDRLNTLASLADSKIKTCCGGILGLGESREDRISFLYEISQLPELPMSLPINMHVKMTGTPLSHVEGIDEIEFVRTIAVARHVFPKTVLRLSAGRQTMSPLTQLSCFMAGANSLWVGEKLLTCDNPERNQDAAFFESIGVNCQHDVINTQA